MNDGAIDNTSTAAQLRHRFDQSFAEPALTEKVVLEDFLAIRLGADPHALRLAEIAHIMPAGAIARFPSPSAELLGVIGFQGSIVPVYDLRMLLGYAKPERPRWLVMISAWPLALAFDAFEGQLRLPPQASARRAGVEHSRRHVHEVLHDDGLVRPVVSVASVLDAIKTAAQRR